MRRTRSAYTLFELVLVLAVLVAVSAVAYPSVEAMYGNYRLTAAVDQVRSAWSTARAHAMEEGTPYRFTLQPDGGRLRVAPDGGTAPGGDAPAYSLEQALPRGVQVAPNGSGDGSALFLPDGTAQGDAEIIFRARGCRPVSLRLRGLTGIVTGRHVGPGA